MLPMTGLGIRTRQLAVPHYSSKGIRAASGGEAPFPRLAGPHSVQVAP